MEYCREKEDRLRHWQQTLKHELFEYQGRISQMVELAEADVPQAIGVLGKVLRHLEEYQAVRAVDPKSAYNDQSFARELWPEEEDAGSEKRGASEKEGASAEERGAGGEQVSRAPSNKMEQGED